jgi:hypothetical protein
MQRGKLVIAALVAWSIATTAFIGYDRWHRFATQELERAADQSRRQILGQILGEAAKCRPFTVANGDQNAQLIGVSCLQQPGAEPSAQR